MICGPHAMQGCTCQICGEWWLRTEPCGTAVVRLDPARVPVMTRIAEVGLGAALDQIEHEQRVRAIRTTEMLATVRGLPVVRPAPENERGDA